jgi:hypothetical protein
MHMQANPQSAPIHIKQIPQPVYPPPPFYPPPYGYRFEIRTVKGLKYINWGLWVNAVAMLVLFAGLATLTTGGFSFFIFILAGEVLILVFFILVLIGLVHMHAGKHEFGPAHSARVTKALIFLAIAFVIAFVGGFSSIFFLFTGGGFTNGFGTNWHMFIIIQLSFGFFTHLFISLMWVFLIIEISEIRIKNFLWLYLGLSLSIYAVSAIFLFVLAVVLSNLQTFVGSLGFIASVVLIYCYWQTYNRVLKGEIKPIPYPLMPPLSFPRASLRTIRLRLLPRILHST